MYNKILNSLFSLTACADRKKAICYVNRYISPVGVQNVLLKKINQNEDARLAVFKGKLAEQIYAEDNLKLQTETLKAAYESGQIDSGNYHTQMHRLRELSKMKEINAHNDFTNQKDDLYADAHRKLSQVGDEVDKSVNNWVKSEEVNRSGPYGMFYRKKQPLKESDKMNI